MPVIGNKQKYGIVRNTISNKDSKKKYKSRRIIY